jgi:hypothetical protein
VSIRASRTDTWLLGAFGLLAVLTGLLAGVDGRFAIAAALAVGFALAALANLTVALALFTFLGFVIVLPAFSGPMQDVIQVSLTIPLLLSWLAVISREGGSEKTFVEAHPAISLVMLMLVAWTGLSLVWAEDGGEALRSVFRYGLALFVMLIVFTAVRTQRDVTMILAALVAGAVGAAAYGFLNPPEAPGLDDRFSGTLDDPNYLAWRQSQRHRSGGERRSAPPPSV